MIPTAYKTGNKKFDEKIEMAFKKDPLRPNRLQRVMLEQGVVEEEKENKYGVAKKEDRTYKDGTVFASKNEMERWDYLLKVQQAGEITELEMQVPFILLEGFISEQYGAIQPMIYVADFTYTNLTFRKNIGERMIVEDSKSGIRTDCYKNKRKLFLYKYGEYLFFEV